MCVENGWLSEGEGRDMRGMKGDEVIDRRNS